MSQVAVVAKVTAQEGKRDELARALQVLLDAAADEPGTIYYLLNADQKDPAVLWMYELYASQAALDEHMGGAAFQSAGPAIGALLAAAPELVFVTPLGGKGL